MLRLENISKSFDKKTIFRDFSYNFQDHGVYALCGKSGVGKTTLLRIICGLDKDYSGNVSGGGISNTSVCFQEHRLFPNLTSLDNILSVSFKAPDDTDKKRAKDLLSRLFFTESDMMLYPHELSGGMKQRVAFARAVLRKAPILILDEATKELDKRTAFEVLQIIKEEAKRRLVIFISHKEEEITELGAERILIE